METPQKIFIAIGTIAVVGLAVVGGKMLFSDDTAANKLATTQSTTTGTQVTAPTTTPVTTPSTSATTTPAGYKDGAYTSTQSYYVPHGETNSLAVTLTIANGKISAVSTKNSYSDRESGMYISSFESSLSSDAKGQSLASYRPSRIGGASLTTEAFYQAISDVKTQAS